MKLFILWVLIAVLAAIMEPSSFIPPTSKHGGCAHHHMKTAGKFCK